MALRPDDNWLQRRYFAWAEQHYRRMPPRTRADVERIDRWLYSRRGAGIWLAMGAAVIASAWALAASGLPRLLAVASSLGIWVALPMGVLGAWLQPERFAGQKAVRVVVLIAAGLWLGAATGFISGRVARYGGLETSTLWPAVRKALGEVAPWLVVAIVVFAAMLQLTALSRRRVLRAQLERATLVAERDAASRQAAEARLRLLQGQIRPHFIFNTLASLQHWVDTGDTRAGPLLRSLTALLRTTTEAMDTEVAGLGAECEAARHYLEIMSARLGSRLAFRVDVDAGVAAVELPAGLVLTLVENAVEHGLEPVLEGGTVEVRARQIDGAVLLSVRDDGVGPGDPARLAEAMAHGVGYANSRQRLVHRYGERARLDLVARPEGRGSEARLVIEGATEPAAAAARP